jgi:hypothetical protein
VFRLVGGCGLRFVYFPELNVNYGYRFLNPDRGR